jgi:hypothetical protein
MKKYIVFFVALLLIGILINFQSQNIKSIKPVTTKEVAIDLIDNSFAYYTTPGDSVTSLECRDMQCVAGIKPKTGGKLWPLYAASIVINSGLEDRALTESAKKIILDFAP